MIIVFIVLSILFILVFFFFIKNHLVVKRMVKAFKKCNVIVFGAKGTGKDLVFQYVINKRKDRYYSNISYGGQYKPIKLNQVSVSPNTYFNFINGDITTIKKDNQREGKDIYISDGGIFLPSQYDSSLYKNYPSFPIYYALSRHLYNSNIHINTQNLERVWKSLREQSDYYVYCVSSISLPFFMLTKCIIYDRYDSALKKLRPLSARVLNKYSKAEYDLYVATNGEINTCYIIQPKKRIVYNTRAFHKIIFNRKAPSY